MFDLADTLLRDAELTAEGFERHAFFDQAAFADDDHLALGEIGERFCEPDLACLAIALGHGFFFGQCAHVGQQILPLAVARFADRVAAVFVPGVLLGLAFERKGYSAGRTQPAPASVGLQGPVLFLLLLVVAEAGAGALVAVGPLSRFTAEEARRGGVTVTGSVRSSW